ncbi:MAG TPA: hypothetical protein VJ720_03510, partial [Chitinophaga sp.]|nr:hypothetical protein [Chitinophaga sp.]
ANIAAKVDADGQIQVTAYEHLRKKKLTDENKAIIIQMVKAEIAEALYNQLQEQKSQKPGLSPAPTGTAPTVPAATPAPAAPPIDIELVPVFVEDIPASEPPATEQNTPTENTPSATGTRSVEQIFKTLKPKRSDGGIAGGQYRLWRSGSVKKEDIESFRKYLQQVLPGIPLHVMENLIQATDGGFAWGVFADNAIYLYSQAEEGTGYHEVFEAVYAMFLSERERQALAQEFSSRKGTFTDRETGETLPFADASTHQVIEQLAEEFREYNLSGTLPVAPKATGFFRRLLNFIKSLLLGKPLQVRELFSRINQGYYSNRSTTQPDVSHSIRYRRIIEGLNTRFIQQVMEGMTAMVFEELFSQNRSLVELDEYNISLKELYARVFERMEQHFNDELPSALLADIEEAALSEEEAEKAKVMYADFYNNTWLPIKNNWNDFVQINESFLKPFKIFFESDAAQEEKEAPINNEDKSFREYERDILKINARKNASTAVKLLIATLTQVEDTGGSTATDSMNPPGKKLSALKLPQLVNYSRTFNRLLYETLGAVSPADMVNRIKGLAVKDKTYVRLFNRLKTAAGYDQLSLYDWKLLIKLFNVAAKQRPDFFIQIQDENGRTFLANANDNRATSQLINTWLENLKATAGKGKLVYIDNNRFRINTDFLRPFQEAIRQVGGKIRFLDALGIDFSEQAYSDLEEKDKRKFNSAVQRLFNVLLKSGDISTVSGRSLGIGGALTHLAEVMVKNNGEDAEAQHFSIEGEPVQNLLLHNYVSTILNDINFYPSKSALLQALPHLGDIFSRDSLLLQEGGILFDENGDRRPDTINISIIEGSKKVGPRPGIPTSKLSLAGRRMQEFNQNINGIYYVLLPADSSTEWSLNLEKLHYVAYSEFFNPGALSNKLFRIFSSYLETELQLVADYDNRAHNQNIRKQGQQLRFFKGILGKALTTELLETTTAGTPASEWIKDNRSRIMEQFNTWMDGLVGKQFEYFREYEVIKALPNGTYNFEALDGDFRDDHKLAAKLSEQDIRTIIRFRTVNYAIQNLELHKVFFGDPALYTDATKRIKSFLSGRETTYHTDNHFNAFANDHLNATSLEGDGIALRPGDPGYWTFKDHMTTFTVADINAIGTLATDQELPPDIRSAYSEANEADAQSWISLPAYRELLLKAGGRWTDAMERQFQYEMAYERWIKAGLGQFDYNERKPLQEHDRKLVEAGNHSYAAFHTIKPIGSGVKAGSVFSDIFLDKTSAVPIYYRMAEGRNLERLYTRMTAEDISYVIMESGRKVGTEQLHSLYNPDGTMSEEKTSGHVKVPFKYFGIQLETVGTKTKQTRGTQLTKLAV